MSNMKLSLEEIKANYEAKASQLKRRIIVCGGTGCVANGSLNVRDAFEKELTELNSKVVLED